LATELERYLKNVRENLRLDPGEEEEVLTELETHAEDRLLEMKAGHLEAGFAGLVTAPAFCHVVCP